MIYENVKKEFRSFKDAKKFIHKLHLKSGKYWKEYCKSGSKPEDIPNHPIDVYKKEWKGMGDWLGTGRIATHLRKYRSFEDAKRYAQKLHFKNKEQWDVHAKSGKLPNDLPRDPATLFIKKKKWGGWQDFLGNKITTRKYGKILDFEDAKKIVHQLEIENQHEWEILSKSGNKPDNIPSLPSRSYKKVWKGWGDWLGTNRIANQDKQYRSFEESREFVRKLKLKNQREWNAYYKSGNKPDNIPSLPSRSYKKVWKGWGNFLGTGTVANQTKSKSWLPWPEAKKLYRKIAKENNLKNYSDWKKYKNTHKLPEGLPAIPANIYTKERVWRKMQK